LLENSLLPTQNRRHTLSKDIFHRASGMRVASILWSSALSRSSTYQGRILLFWVCVRSYLRDPLSRYFKTLQCKHFDLFGTFNVSLSLQ
jgi:hypothetical protein